MNVLSIYNTLERIVNVLSIYNNLERIVSLLSIYNILELTVKVLSIYNTLERNVFFFVHIRMVTTVLYVVYQNEKILFLIKTIHS